MKKLLLAVSLMFAFTTARAQEVAIPLLGTLSLSALQGMISNTRADFVYNHDSTKLSGIHLPLLALHTAGGTEIANINLGVAWNINGGATSGPFGSIGLRLDNLANTIGAVASLKKYAAIAALPAVEVGPFGGYTAQSKWLYGLFVSSRIGG